MSSVVSSRYFPCRLPKANKNFTEGQSMVLSWYFVLIAQYSQHQSYLEIIKVRINFVFQENGRAFRSRPLVEVDPKCLLYVQQREFAATTPEDRKSNYYNRRVLLSIEMWFIYKIYSKTVYVLKHLTIFVFLFLQRVYQSLDLMMPLLAI